MVLRKITIDNSVRYIPKNEQNPTKNRIQPVSGGKLNTKKQKNISQNNKKFIKNVVASGFGVLTK